MAEQSLFHMFPIRLSCFNALRPVPMQIDPGGVATQWLCPSCSSVCAGSEAFVFKLIALRATRCISARRAIWAAVDGKGASMRIPRSLDEDMQCWHHAGGISEYFAIPKSAPCQSIFFLLIECRGIDSFSHILLRLPAVEDD